MTQVEAEVDILEDILESPSVEYPIFSQNEMRMRQNHLQIYFTNHK